MVYFIGKLFSLFFSTNFASHHATQTIFNLTITHLLKDFRIVLFIITILVYHIVVFLIIILRLCMVKVIFVDFSIFESTCP